MLFVATQGIRPELREIVLEASLALARLDTERLEQLAAYCQVLQHDLVAPSVVKRNELALQARCAVGEMAVFGRVLDATRVNLEVMNRARERRTAPLEYGEVRAPWALPEIRNGDH